VELGYFAQTESTYYAKPDILAAVIFDEFVKDPTLWHFILMIYSTENYIIIYLSMVGVHIF
jgi:hypothetical protein